MGQEQTETPVLSAIRDDLRSIWYEINDLREQYLGTQSNFVSKNEWQRVNEIIDELSQKGVNCEHARIGAEHEIRRNHLKPGLIDRDFFVQRLGSLRSAVKAAGNFYLEDSSPNSAPPTSMFNISMNQSVTINVDALIGRLERNAQTDEEKTYVDALKKHLKNGQDITESIAGFLKASKDVGYIAAPALASLLKLLS